MTDIHAGCFLRASCTATNLQVCHPKGGVRALSRTCHIASSCNQGEIKITPITASSRRRARSGHGKSPTLLFENDVDQISCRIFQDLSRQLHMIQPSGLEARCGDFSSETHQCSDVDLRIPQFAKDPMFRGHDPRKRVRVRRCGCCHTFRRS